MRSTAEHRFFVLYHNMHSHLVGRLFLDDSYLNHSLHYTLKILYTGRHRMSPRASQDLSGRLVSNHHRREPPHQHSPTAISTHSSTPDEFGEEKMTGKSPLGTPPVISAAPDLSRELGGPSLPSTASSLGGLFSFLSPRSGDQILLDISDSEGYSSGSEVSHVSSEEVETAMTADDVPDTMVDSALSLDALSWFLHENRDIIELSTTDIAMYIGAIMRVMDVIAETGLAAKCVSWDDTGEVRESLALSCRSLLSSICPEGALSTSSLSVVIPDVAPVFAGDPLGTSFTSDGGNRGNPPASEVLSGASKPRTPTQARKARRKKLAEARARSRLSSDD